MAEYRQKYLIWMPLMLVGLATLLSWQTNLDLSAAQFFYNPGAVHWPIGSIFPFDLANKYGQLIGWIPALLGLGVLIGSFWHLPLRRLRNTALFMVLLLIIGPGLLVNMLFKPNWDRPRPNQVLQFEGESKFIPAGMVGPPAVNKNSFPSGHAAMGFIFMTPYFVLLVRNRKAAHLWLAGGILFGIFIGLARMAKGAHWASDVAWSFGVVYVTAYVLARLLRLDRRPALT